MFILTVKGREKEGAYSVIDEDGDQVLYLFEEEDDAIRFALLLEEEGHLEMHVLEVEDEIMLKTCQTHGYNYSVITSADVVIPPPMRNDII
jgi:hypothetical protein|tara:strand:+ start:399 stop:671 length:273 start_codon:yes stop_codon:yes gene_type:complete